MKFIVRAFFLLLLVNVFLLYMHYSQAGKATATSDIQLTYTQEIEVMNRPDGLYIRHHFIGLSDARHEIVWPYMSTKRSCYLVDGTSCSRLNEKITAFVEGETDRQSIMYVIPKSKAMDESILFEDVFATIDRLPASATLLHLTDEMGIGGLWITGFKSIGKKKMDLIDYSLYSGKGELSDLYWHQEELPIVYSGERLSVFSSQTKLEDAEFEKIDDALVNVDALHSTIVFDNKNKGITSNRFIVSEAVTTEKVGDLLLVNNMYNRFLISENDLLTAEVIASLLSQRGVGSEKARAIFDVLVNNITSKDLEKVSGKLRSLDGNPVDASHLDKVIGDVTGFKTSFITKNNNSEVDLYPYLLQDSREVYIAGKENEDVTVILKDGKTLYPVTKVMRELGYKVSSTDQSLYVENKLRSFRFPLKELFYVYNEKRYNVMSVPFEQIGDEFYFEEASFIRIFRVEINKTAEAVEIKPFGEEGYAN